MNGRMRSILCIGALFLLFAITATAWGASGTPLWTDNGVGVRTGEENPAINPQITSDGAGGAVITWRDWRSGRWDIYAQRINSSGIPLWTGDGLGVRNASPFDAYGPQITSDGAGGAIVTWEDYRSGIKTDIYAQRINSSGNCLWTADGLGVRTAAADRAIYPQITSDGAGGAIIVWQDYRSGSKSDIYAQRVNSSGIPLWTADGVGVRTAAPNDVYHPQITSDGDGGAVIAWQDHRSGSTWDIYAQRINANGNCLWTADGVGVRTAAANNARYPQITSDGAGGAVIAWEDYRSGSKWDIYAQRINANGTTLWTADGVGVRTASMFDAAKSRITSDGAGGAVIAWEDGRSGSKWDIYAQRINASGTCLWTADGVGMRPTEASDARYPQITTDGVGGAVIVWQDYRSSRSGIYAQRINANGTCIWTADGVEVREPASTIAQSPQIDSDGSGGAVIAWDDERSGITNKVDIYAQRIKATYTITAGAGTGGCIGPAGVLIVEHGVDQAYAITPDAGCHVADVLVDGVSQGPLTSYTFEGVTADHTIEASFAVNTYDINASVFYTGHGTVDPGSQAVGWGADAVVDLVPDPGYHAAYILDNGAPVAVADPYVITGVAEDHSVIAFFARNTYTLQTGVAGQGEVAANPDESEYEEGTEVTLTAEPAPGWHFAGWSGDLAGSANPASLVMDADKDVTASFEADFFSYFAEGCTHEGFQEYLCLANPDDTDAGVTLTYLFADGTTQSQALTIPASSRVTVDVNAAVGAGRDVSVKVQSGAPIVAERPMYFDYGGSWAGGSCVMGASAPSEAWYFAEGYTGPGFEEYVCVLNPGEEAAELTFRFQTQEEGEVVAAGFGVAPGSRATFKVNDLLGPGYQASLALESTKPVVAERPMYFSYGPGWTGGHCAVGAPALTTEYFFAEGTTRAGFCEYLTLQNPGAGTVTIDALYQLGAGQGESVARSYTLGAGSRLTVRVEDEVGPEKDVSVRLTSSDPFLAERPTYFSYGPGWTGGHCVIGATSPGAEWFFAEGYTGEGFDEYLCLQNPGDADATVQVTYLTQEEGPLPAETWVIPAGSRATFKVNDHAGPGLQLSVKLQVTSGPGIVAERPMYFSYGPGWTGGHDVAGYVP